MEYGIKVTALGAAAPDKVVSNDDLAAFLDTNDEWISERTGIKERRVCSEGEDGLSLSINAYDKIKDKVADPLEIDLIIVATATPDYLYPSTACRIQEVIGARNAACFDLSAACSGFIYSLVTAAQFLQTGTYKKALVFGVDIHSRVMDWTDRSTAILFGDGAGVALVEACSVGENQLLSHHLGSDGSGGCDLSLKAVGTGYPSGKADLPVETVFMNGRKIYQFAVVNVPKIIQLTAERAGISTDQIDYLLCHQANQRILDSVAERLGWDKERCLSNIARYGNTSAASIPLVWEEHWDKIETGSTICLAGFGAGLTTGSVILRV